MDLRVVNRALPMRSKQDLGLRTVPVAASYLSAPLPGPIPPASTRRKGEGDYGKPPCRE